MLSPSALFWNRLEPQPKGHDLSVALRCEVRDALWMLGRQWQMGEFRAEDAGACAFVKVQTDSVVVQKLSLRGNAPREYSPETPLNFLTEGIAPLENHSPSEGSPPSLSLDLRLEIGRRWLHLLKTKLTPAIATAAVNAFKGNPSLHFRMPVAETLEDQVVHAATFANQPYAQALSALSHGRALDGWELFRQLQTQKASSFLPQADAEVDQLGEDFRTWVTDTFPTLAPNAVSGWNAARLEYHFDCAAPSTLDEPTILRVPEHDGSFLDWFTFEEGEDGATPVHPDLKQPIPITATRRRATLLPRLVTFAGAPRNRWWEMEDSTIDLANLRPTPSDPAQFILAEFALLFSNDWLSFPLELPIGSLSEISNLVVTDVFGDVTEIKATPQTANSGLFSIAAKKNSALWIPSAATSIIRGLAKEEVLLLRDEMANLAWGIENVIPDGLGGGMDGLDAAMSLRSWLEQLLEIEENPVVDPSSQFADRRYILGTSVPEHWIPFVPIRFNKNGQMCLRRAALPRTLGSRPPVRIRPRTQLLREGLESADIQSFDLNEEEITMPGIVVRERWRQARWFDGKMFTWLAREKMYAQPTRALCLRFDSAVSVEKVQD